MNHLRLVNPTVQSKHDCPPRRFCGGLIRKRPLQLEKPLWGGLGASLPFPAPPLSPRPEACSAKREGGPPGKPGGGGALNYRAALLAPHSPGTQLNNSPPGKAQWFLTAKVGQLPPCPGWGLWAQSSFPTSTRRGCGLARPRLLGKCPADPNAAPSEGTDRKAPTLRPPRASLRGQ